MVGTLADLVNSNFGVPSPGAVNDKLRAFYSSIHTGLGPPSAGVGSNGDFYFDVLNGVLYGKFAGVWSATGGGGGGGAISDVLNVKDYGAVGDGIANDTTAFSDAIAAVAGETNDSARLWVPAGSYLVDGIVLPEDGRVELYGAGARATNIILNPAAASGSKLLTASGNGVAFFNVYIHDLALSLNGVTDSIGLYVKNAQETFDVDRVIVRGAPAAGSVNTGGWAVVIDGASPSSNEVRIRRSHFFNVANGLDFGGGTNFAFEDSTIDRNLETGDTDSVGVQIGSGEKVSLQGIHLESFRKGVTVSGTVTSFEAHQLFMKRSAVSTQAGLEIASGCHRYLVSMVTNKDQKYAHTIDDQDRTLTFDNELVVKLEAGRNSDVGGGASKNYILSDDRSVLNVYPGSLDINNGKVSFNEIAWTAGDTTPDCSGGNLFTVDNSGEAGTVVITDFDGSRTNFVAVKVTGTKTRFGDALVVGGSNIDCGGANINAISKQTYCFVKIASVWRLLGAWLYQRMDLLTAKGSLYVATASATVAEHTVPSDGLVMVGNSGETDGWINDYPMAAQVAYLRPTGAIAETVSRAYGTMINTVTAVTAGTALVIGIILPKGKTLTSGTFFSGNTAPTLTHQWFGIADSSLLVLRKTSDDTSTAWSAGTSKTLNYSSQYVTTYSGLYYVFIVVTGGTPINYTGFSDSASGPNNVAPIFCGTSTTGLTDPASLGASLAALTATGRKPWGWVS